MNLMRMWRWLLLAAVAGVGGACGSAQAKPSLPAWHAGSGSYYNLASVGHLDWDLAYLRRQYVRSGHSLNGLQLPTALFTATGIRRLSGRVSVVVHGQSAVILTDSGPANANNAKPICYGILWITERSAAVFSDYPATANAGAYYFVAPYSKLTGCRASEVRPPAPDLAGSYLDAKAFP